MQNIGKTYQNLLSHCIFYTTSPLQSDTNYLRPLHKQADGRTSYPPNVVESLLRGSY